MQSIGAQDMDIIDLETMTWMQPNLSGTLPQARNAHTMTAAWTQHRHHPPSNPSSWSGHSGNKHLTDLHIFDTQKLHWSQPEILGTPPPGEQRFSSSTARHKIFLFGGYDGKGRTNELYILDTAEAPPRQPRPHNSIGKFLTA
eukprot:Skav229029  [mRNA]  locus=scaffold127:671472:672841:- [translate_table: standard]